MTYRESLCDIEERILMQPLSDDNRLFIDILRGGSIFRVVLAHLGLSWLYQPYSGYVLVFLPVLFFVSGAVTYGSFLNKKKNKNFLLNRYFSLAIPYYLFLLISFICLWLYESRLPLVDFESLLQYLSFNALSQRENWPLPLGPVWFLHSLLYINLISYFLFILSRKSSYFLLVGLIFSLALGFSQSHFNVATNFWLFGHNFYQPLSNIGFFILGSFWYVNRVWFTRKLNLLLFISVLILNFIYSYLFVDNYAIEDHFYYPNLFFMLSCFSAIFLILFFEKEILFIVNRISSLKSFLLFMNRNSYSIYLIHAYIINILAIKFGLMGLSGEPSRAFLKVFVTILITCIFSVPFTLITKNTTLYMKNNLLKY